MYTCVCAATTSIDIPLLLQRQTCRHRTLAWLKLVHTMKHWGSWEPMPVRHSSGHPVLSLNALMLDIIHGCTCVHCISCVCVNSSIWLFVLTQVPVTCNREELWVTYMFITIECWKWTMCCQSMCHVVVRKVVVVVVGCVYAKTSNIHSYHNCWVITQDTDLITAVTVS